MTFQDPLHSAVQVCSLIWMLNQEESPSKLPLTVSWDFFPFQLYNSGARSLLGISWRPGSGAKGSYSVPQHVNFSDRIPHEAHIGPWVLVY